MVSPSSMRHFRLVGLVSTLLLLLLLVGPTSVRSISLTPETYRNLVVRRCFNFTLTREPLVRGQDRPVGSSIDYLISLIQKIENYRPEWTSQQVVVAILRRFHYDDIQTIRFEHIQSLTGTSHRDLNEKIFQDSLSKFPVPSFPEEMLTEDEKCALFFLVSHTVNTTVVDRHDGTDREVFYSELGTASLLNSNRVSIGVNSLLLGVAVGLLGITSIDSSKLFGLSLQNPLDPLLAVTLSDKLALPTLNNPTDQLYNPLFGAEGLWNSSYCQIEYRLTNTGHASTMADIGGGIDGYLIGRKLLSPTGEFLRQLKLSTLLEHYYRKDGLAPDCGICFTNYLTSETFSNLRDNAETLALLWNRAYNKDRLSNEQLSYFVNLNSINFNQFFNLAKQVKIDECARMSNLDYGEDQCETTSDIFVMIDNNVLKYSYFQLELIKNLLVKLKSLNFLGTVTVLANAYAGYSPDIQQMNTDFHNLRIQLHLIAYNTTSIEQATCRLAWYPYRETTINDKKYLMKHLVDFFEINNITNSYGENSRNLLWLSLASNTYQRLTERDKMTFYQYRWYLKYYLNVRTFFASVYDKVVDDDLFQIMLNQDDWFRVNPANIYDNLIVSQLARRMCETPVALSYQDCYNRSSDDVTTEHRITPNRKQYWVIYPKYFMEQKWVRLKANNTPIKVCVDRWLHPENNQQRCKTSNKDTEEVSFEIERPCRWQTLDKCLPIYFTVQLPTKNLVAPNDCLDTRCKTFDQVKWWVSHSGLFCVPYNAAVLTAHLGPANVVLFAALIYIFHYFF